MNAASIGAWLRQTTTIAGLSTIVGTVCAVLGGQLTWPQAVPLFCGAVAAMLLPENGRGPTVVTGPSTSVTAETVAVQPAPGSTTTIR